MDKLFDFWNRLDQPGFAVVVVKEGQVVYQKVFGLACQEHGVAITPNSVFNTATLAQAFVGQAIAMLEKQGKLTLDDDVRKFIPEIPDFGTPIKLRHLLYPQQRAARLASRAPARGSGQRGGHPRRRF